MVDKIEITVIPESFEIAVGDFTEATATIRNLGQTVDQFTFSVDGLNRDWYDLNTSSVALFPNDQENLKIIIHPPKTDETKAGTYNFRLIVASREDPLEKENVELTLIVKTPPELKLELDPPRITGRRGIYKILAVNPGDRPVTLRLDAVDDQAILRYKFGSESLDVPGGGYAESLLKVRLGWADFFVGERECNFQILATLPNANDVTAVSGQLVTIPWYRPLLRLRLPRIKIASIIRPPTVLSFMATTEDKRDFKLVWSVKGATDIRLNNEEVGQQGEKKVSPGEAITYVLTALNKRGVVSRTVDVQPVVLPSGKNSERIRVSVSLTELEVNAGGIPVTSTIEMQNFGEIVDKFSVEVAGLDESWYSRSVSSVALMPKVTDQGQISFHPPKIEGVLSGTYPFALVVSSQHTPEDRSIIEGLLKVLPSAELMMNVAPIRVSCRRKAKFRIILANRGVSNVEAFLEATDLDEKLRFRIKNRSPIVDAWQTFEIPVVAKPRRSSLIGEMKRYDITFTARMADGSSQSVRCEMHHRPLISSWRPIKYIIIAAIIILLVHYIVVFGGGWSNLFKSPQEWLYAVIRHVRGWFY